MQRQVSPDDEREPDSESEAPDDRLQRVAARYAVAITPAMSRLVQRAQAGKPATLEPSAQAGKPATLEPSAQAGKPATLEPSAQAGKPATRDPIAQQFLPDVRELVTRGDESDDPIGDHVHEAVPGLVHRYPDRVLLKLVGACAVYCRFCFRREMVGPENGRSLSPPELAAAIDYIRNDPGIWEVILSGGDPLVASPRRIRELGEALARIGHVKVLRWHTRVPAVAPERITPELVAALRSAPQAVWVALHVNHPRELTSEARAAIARLVDAGIAMVSQTVLLRGVNDDPVTLEALLRTLVECRVKPYYLHHLDRAPGTSHFRTPVAEGQALIRALRGRVSGLAQPTYVLDIPGGHGKVPIGPGFIEAIETGDGHTTYAVRDIAGCCHRYAEPATDRKLPNPT